jgi:hypothetical protein
MVGRNSRFHPLGLLRAAPTVPDIPDRVRHQFEQLLKRTPDKSLPGLRNYLYFYRMPPRTKTSYHPHLLIAFYLNCLPPDWLQSIPRSTRHEWSQIDHTALYGYEWAMQNQQLFDTLREVSTSRRLLRINKALLRLIALKRFIDRHHVRLKDHIPPVRDVVLHTIEKTTGILPLKSVLKYLQQSYRWYGQLRNEQRCRSSLFFLCRIKYPSQLVMKEINTIKTYCADSRFIHWPLVSSQYNIVG